MKLTYTERAVRDLVRLRDFIRKKNPQAAQNASRQLQKNIKALIDHPKLGTALSDLGEFRELVAHDYIVRYRIVQDEIVILKVWHEREDR